MKNVKKFDILVPLLWILIFLELIICLLIFRNSQYYYKLFQTNLEVPGFDSIEAASNWCFVNVRYVTDKESTGYDEYFKTPQRTLKDGCGDCDDYAILLLYIVKQKFNIEGEFYSVKTPIGYHAIAKIDGEFYDPTNNKIGYDKDNNIEIGLIYNYNEVMNKTYNGYYWNK